MQGLKLLLFLLVFGYKLSAQVDVSLQPSTTIAFDIIHTDMYLKPIWTNNTIESKVILKLKPHFYAQNSIKLNAKGFTLNGNIKVNNKEVSKNYNGDILDINFDRTYDKSDTLLIEINYISNPDKLKVKGSESIVSDKGLYFINTDQKIKGLPMQLWTQGETQANSAWFPTIDSPNQKHSQDIYLTVDKALITLSNGILVDTKSNADGTKTDHWKQTLPHSVYLTMIAVGNFKKVIDPASKTFEISYYVEPEYEKYAQGIFGRTPEMIKFFEEKLGVKYQWAKYAQIPVRKYVSGAMENTTATIHGKSVLKNFNQLIDGNDDGVIAHELFHHWFGDLVTCESWSNLPLNESFANYSEFLWATHKYGKDEGDYVYVTALEEYLNEAQTKSVPLIRYNYADREDMFDAHSYQKGGRILHTLRQEIGDEAFFESLKLYLEKNKFQTAEVDDLRQAFEKVTGRDLRLFFDQYFLAEGHPSINTNLTWKTNDLKISIFQPDSLNARLYDVNVPVLIFFKNGKSELKHYRIKFAENNIADKFDAEIEHVIINPDGYFLGEIKEDNLGQDRWLKNLKYANTYYAKNQALNMLAAVNEKEENPLLDVKVRNAYFDALKDVNWRIRLKAVQQFFDYDGDDFLKIEKALQQIISSDPRSNVRAEAILASKNFLNPQNDILFRNALSDTSFAVRGAALDALVANNVTDLPDIIKKYENVDDINIFTAVANYYSNSGDANKYDWYMDKYARMEGIELYQSLALFGTYLSQLDEQSQLKPKEFLRKMSQDEPEWYIKLSATQVIYTLAATNEAYKKLLKETVEKETNPRLIQYYSQIKE